MKKTIEHFPLADYCIKEILNNGDGNRDTACGDGGQPSGDGDRNNGDGLEWGPVLVPV